MLGEDVFQTGFGVAVDVVSTDYLNFSCGDFGCAAHRLLLMGDGVDLIDAVGKDGKATARSKTTKGQS